MSTLKEVTELRGQSCEMMFVISGTSTTVTERHWCCPSPVGDMDNPLHNTGRALGPLKNETRLSSWLQRYRRWTGVRSKTLIRILLTKWWEEGIEWYERMLLEILLNRSKEIWPEFTLLKSCTNKILKEQAFPGRNVEFDLQEYLLDDLPKLLYSPQQYRAVTGLRRIRKLFSLIYVALPPEQSGIPRLKRQRIRGYRDGKGKPMDPGLRDCIAADQFYYNLIEGALDEFIENGYPDSYKSVRKFIVVVGGATLYLK